MFIINSSEPNTTIISYLSYFSLFGITDCFNCSNTKLMATLDSSDSNNTLTPNTITKPLCLNIHNVLIIWGTNVHHFLSAGWSGPYAQVFLFQKLVVAPREKSLLDLLTGLIVARHNKQVVHILSLLVALGMTASVATETTELTSSLSFYYQLSSQFI